MTEGSFQSTNNPLDIAIEGNGFLRVGPGSPNGEELTRACPRTSSTRAPATSRRTSGYLTTQARRIRDRPQRRRRHRNRNRRHLRSRATKTATSRSRRAPPTSRSARTAPSATPTRTQNRKRTCDRVTAGYISLATFPNESGLERLGGSLWAHTANSGAPIVGTPDTPGFGSTIGGELEMSNVDMATEMTNMITAERGYQANSRVITTADEMSARWSAWSSSRAHCASGQRSPEGGDR